MKKEKEANELKQIWQFFNDRCIGKPIYYEKLPFWILKAKIDDYKKQIIDTEKEVDRLMEILDNYP